MGRKILSLSYYVLLILFVTAVGLLITKSVIADVKAEEVIEEADNFIEKHEETKAIISTSVEYPELSIPDKAGNANISKILEITTEEYIEEFTYDTTYDDSSNWIDSNSNSDIDYIDPIVETPLMTPEEFQSAGIIEWNGWKFTYYSEQVLPGGGLQIPGRWSDGQFVRDENGYLCVACNDLEQGTVVDTPFGSAIVYDWVGDDIHGLIDIYVSW